MIRALALSLGCIAATLALVLLSPSGPTGHDALTEDTVSRATTNGLVPLDAAAPLFADTSEPQVNAPPAPLPVARLPDPATPPSPTEAAELAVKLMSQALIDDLQAASTPSPGYAMLPATEDASATRPRVYEVQPGDSLAGISFRFFGSTALYPAILDANSDALPDPTALQAGMILTIPHS